MDENYNNINSGYVPQGTDPQGYQPQTTGESDYQPQGYTQTGYQPQGNGQTGYQSQGYPQTAYQPQGYGQQGYANGYNQNAYNPVPQKKNSTKAILSLIFGIAGIVTCCAFGILGVILGIAGVVLAILSRNDNDGKMEGLAVAGLVVSVVAFVFGLGYLCIMVFAIAEDPNYIKNNIASAAIRAFNGNVLS